ncbi:unnamed protein product [Diamesa tonsa]
MMSSIENDSKVIEDTYQTIKSNLIWEIKNDSEQNSSKKVLISQIDVEWYLTINLNGDEPAVMLFLTGLKASVEDPNSEEDQYYFSFKFDSRPRSNGAVFKKIKTNIHEKHKLGEIQKESFHIINATVTIKTHRNFFSKLLDDFGKLMLDSTHSDFTIFVQSKEFKVHKSVLSARSPVFKIMFLSKMKEAAEKKVEIIDVDPDVFEQLLTFIYSGEIADLDDYAMDLFVAADKYGIKDLRNVCENHIFQNISNDNAMAVYKLATLYSCNHDLKQMSFQIIKKKLQETSIVGNYKSTIDCSSLEQLLEIKKTFDTLLNETFKSVEIEEKAESVNE